MKLKHKELHRIASTAIIYKKEKDEYKYLITQRSFEKKAFPGLWTVPGGGLETDDYIHTPKTTQDHWYFAIEKSLHREILEEVNLKVGKIEYLLDMVFIRSDGIPCIVLSWYCPYKSGKIKYDSDTINHAWVKINQLKKYNLIEGIRKEIEMVDKILNGKKKNLVKFKK